MLRPIQRILVLLFSASLVFAGSCTSDDARISSQAEILWDSWGVPHIYAKRNDDLFRAFGWAQMKDHRNLLLELYGQARGRAAEYWGEDWVASDRWVRTMGVYARAEDWYQKQDPNFRNYLDAFADGINQYGAEHRDTIDERFQGVLPVDAVDVLAHAQLVIHFSFVGPPDSAKQAAAHLDQTGSNAFAIAPSRSESGNAMLMINPHLSWSGAHTFYEAQLEGPNIDFYGATLVGFPIMVLGFNDHLGWSHTVNMIDVSDTFELILEDGGYRYDGKLRKFDEEEQTLLVRTSDGSINAESLVIQRSLHGPVIAQSDDKAVAFKVVGLNQPSMLEQWWDMSHAKNVQQFEQNLARLQIPMFNVIYADGDGRILYVFNGLTPKRAGGEYLDWAGVVPGHTSKTFLKEMHPYEDLPRVLDPDSGWLQNANDPPWTVTYPKALDSNDFPSYMAPQFMHFRAQQSATLLYGDKEISFDELVAYKHSTKMLLADRLLDDLIAAARLHGDERAKAAATILETWDRSANATSKGAVLFERWALEMGFGNLFSDEPKIDQSLMEDSFIKPWNSEKPHMTPSGLRDLKKAAHILSVASERVEQMHGSADVAWGDVYRIRTRGRDLPANGGPGEPTGLFRSSLFKPGDNGDYEIFGGDTFYAVVEFSRPLKAKVLLAYGNSSQPDSPHFGDQLEMFAEKKMRTPLLSRAEVEADMESQKTF